LLEDLRSSELQTPDDKIQLVTRAIVLQNRCADLNALDDGHAATQLLSHVQDPVVRASFRNVYAYACAMAGLYRQASETIEAQIDDIARHKLAFVRPYAHFARAMVLFARREFDEGFAHLAQADDEAQRAADTYGFASPDGSRAR